VTGSKDHVDELARDTCIREVAEETGIDAALGVLEDWALVNRYEIYPHWRHRYPEGVTHNTEYVFGLRLPAPLPVRLSPREHLQYAWLPWREAAQRCFSWSNVQAIESLAARHA
jgi:dATP pyrophosphohydrolase